MKVGNRKMRIINVFVCFSKWRICSNRIKGGKENKFEIREARGNLYLVNPDTFHHVEPTRGMGDFIMRAAGFTSEPEISATFSIKTSTLILAASDGIFDLKVWQENDFIEFVSHLLQEHGEDTSKLAEAVYRETLEKAYSVLHYTLIDDMSMFICLSTGVKTDI
uniref:PPM-type phosphatase domain-containing protein n=1 Tax=Aplanochytrium stocchinoi TaxID=215587 RepID=A0A7S3LK48_9STRA